MRGCRRDAASLLVMAIEAGSAMMGAIATVVMSAAEADWMQCEMQTQVGFERWNAWR
eukprot:m.45324 g.45324  ORF g.45324 m.45324 type:complete len:57 (-) comp15123_c0_seq4:431-601(-)